MLFARELLLALLTAQINNARIYEYLLGALLEPKDRARVEPDMLKCWQKSTTYLDTTSRDLETELRKQTEMIGLLRTELDLNKQLLQSLRKCQTDLYVKQGYGVPVMRCTSKWAFKDFPDLLGRIQSPDQSLTVLCTHVLDKYSCCQDPLIDSVRQEVEGKVKCPVARQEHRLPTECMLEKSEITKVEETLKQLEVSSISENDDNNINVTYTNRVRALRCRLRECLDQMKAVALLCKAGESPYLIDADVQSDHPAVESQPDNVPYWVPDLYQTPVPLPKDNGTTKSLPNSAYFTKKRSVKIPIQHTPVHKRCSSDGTPVWLGGGLVSSPCAVRSSKMTPMRAPVKKAKLAITLPHYEATSDEEELPVLEPYTKPLFRKRVSLVPEHETQECKEKWANFYTHLQAVRLRVIKRLNRQFTLGSRLSRRRKQKKKKSRRKSKKLATAEVQSVGDKDVVTQKQPDISDHVVHKSDVNS